MHETGVEAGLMTHNTVIAACVRAQNPDKAMEVFAMIRERGLKPDQVGNQTPLGRSARQCTVYIIARVMLSG